MDEGRKADIKELDKIRKTAPDKETLKNVAKVEATIKSESHDGYIRDARRIMVREAKKGRMGNVHGIQDTLAKRVDKHSGLGKTSFAFPADRMREIYGK